MPFDVDAAELQPRLKRAGFEHVRHGLAGAQTGTVRAADSFGCSDGGTATVAVTPASSTTTSGWSLPPGEAGRGRRSSRPAPEW